MPLQFSIFDKYPELAYGISEKSDGSMRLLTDDSLYRPTLRHRKKYFAKINVCLDQIVQGWLIHGNNVELITKKQTGKIIPDADALITAAKNILLAVTNADCFPIYFFDPQKKAAGIAHAGWRGVVKNIAGKTVRSFTKKFKTNKSDILVAIGPGIRECHFEIKKDNVHFYEKYPEHVVKRNDQVFINLAGIIKKQLIAAGVKEKNIEDSRLCTYCLKDKYFSYRRDKPEIIEAMIAYIGLRI